MSQIYKKYTMQYIHVMYIKYQIYGCIQSDGNFYFYFIFAWTNFMPPMLATCKCQNQLDVGNQDFVYVMPCLE